MPGPVLDASCALFRLSLRTILPIILYDEAQRYYIPVPWPPGCLAGKARIQTQAVCFQGLLTKGYSLEFQSLLCS